MCFFVLLLIFLFCSSHGPLQGTKILFFFLLAPFFGRDCGLGEHFLHCPHKTAAGVKKVQGSNFKNATFGSIQTNPRGMSGCRSDSCFFSRLSDIQYLTVIWVFFGNFTRNLRFKFLGQKWHVAQWALFYHIKFFFPFFLSKKVLTERHAIFDRGIGDEDFVQSYQKRPKSRSNIGCRSVAKKSNCLSDIRSHPEGLFELNQKWHFWDLNPRPFFIPAAQSFGG